MLQLQCEQVQAIAWHRWPLTIYYRFWVVSYSSIPMCLFTQHICMLSHTHQQACRTVCLQYLIITYSCKYLMYTCVGISLSFKRKSMVYKSLHTYLSDPWWWQTSTMYDIIRVFPIHFTTSALKLKDINDQHLSFLQIKQPITENLPAQYTGWFRRNLHYFGKW